MNAKALRDVKVLLDSIVNADPETPVEEIKAAAQQAKDILCNS